MLRRLLSLILLYSIIIFAIAGPTLATKTSSSRDKPSKDTKKLSCPVCAANPQGTTLADRIDGLATVGRSTQMHPLAPVVRSSFEGVPVNFVSTATGKLAFAVNDLTLGGSMPLFFQRVYTSEGGEDVGLGEGWSFLFNDRITIGAETATLTGGDGRVIAFRAFGQIGHFILKTPEPGVHQSFDVNENSISEQAAGFTRMYKKVGNAYRLTQVTDSNGNSINIAFDSRGHVNLISASGGTFSLKWSDNKDARLLEVTDSTGRRVGFKHEGHRLRGVTDAAGNQWNYDYSERALIRATDPLGRILLRVRYDRSGRVVESGDAAGTSVYSYDASSPTISQHTVVTDPVGVKTVFEHNRSGMLTAAGEGEEQAELQIEYDSANRATRLSTQTDGELHFSFDGQNRLTQLISADGSSKAYSYNERGQISSRIDNGTRTDFTRDERGNAIVAKSSDASQSYRAAYDGQGRLTAIESDAGRKISNEYDAAGNTIAFTSAKDERIQLDVDAAGRTTTEWFPSGLSVSYERDARGIVTKKSDNRGQFVTVERDASGAVSGFANAAGVWLRTTRDHAGRIVGLKNSVGKTRTYAYDARGALTDFTNALGHHKKVGYDGHGRVHTVSDDDGSRTLINRDHRGRIQLISLFKEGGSRYDYDPQGQLVAINGTKSRGKFINAAYSVSSVSVPAPQGMDCFMGNDWFSGDSFGSSFGFGVFELDCGLGFGGGAIDGGGFGCDPFGGFDPFDSSGFSFDPFGCNSLFKESCASCRIRQRQICDKTWKAAYKLAVGGDAIATAACSLITAGTLALVCAAAAGIYAVLKVMSLNDEWEVCILHIPDNCKDCR